MNEMYWITRLDYINGLAIGILVLSGILLIVYMIDHAGRSENTISNKPMSVKWLYTAIISIVISTSTIVFLPSTKDALMIYGVGGTIDYIQQNKTAQGIPDKFFKAVDKYLDTTLQEDSVP